MFPFNLFVTHLTSIEGGAQRFCLVFGRHANGASYCLQIPFKGMVPQTLTQLFGEHSSRSGQKNGWIQVRHGLPGTKFTSATYHVQCTRDDLLELQGPMAPGPAQVLTMDIETNSGDLKSFCMAHNPQDYVFEIGVIRYGLHNPQLTEPIVFCRGRTQVSKKTHIRFYGSETEVLDAFAGYVKFHDIDVFVTFYGTGFDWQYLYDRAYIAEFMQVHPFAHVRTVWSRLRAIKIRYKPLYQLYKATKSEATKASIEALLHGRLVPDPPTRALWNIRNVLDLKHFHDMYNAQPRLVHFFDMARVKFCRNNLHLVQHGNITWKVLDDGRRDVDMHTFIKQGSMKLPKYSLNACAKHFLQNISKDDILQHYAKNQHMLVLRNPNSTKNAYHMMFEYEFSQNPELRRIVAEYCHQDNVVTYQLCVKLDAVMTSLKTWLY